MTQDARPSGDWMSRSSAPSPSQDGGGVSGVETTVKTNWLRRHCREKSWHEASWVTVPQSDTGRRGEYPKALERTPVKELGKLAP